MDEFSDNETAQGLQQKIEQILQQEIDKLSPSSQQVVSSIQSTVKSIGVTWYRKSTWENPEVRSMLSKNQLKVAVALAEWCERRYAASIELRALLIQEKVKCFEETHEPLTLD